MAQARSPGPHHEVDGSHGRGAAADVGAADDAGRNAVTGSVGIDFEATGRKSTKLIKATGIAKQLGDRPLFDDLSFELTPGTKLGLLGRNGSGKTTLLRCLTGEMTPDAGTLERADGLRVVVFDQDRRQLDRTATLKRALSPNSDTVEYRGRPYHLTAWAKRFLFRPEQLEVPVSDLSGGEQARILIARLMLKPADVLLLDEPTNDLDIASLEVLEESLEDFPGALVLVTHDRSLLDRLCSAIVGLDGQGGSRVFSDYTQWTAAQAETDAAVKKAASKPAAREAAKKKKMAYREQKELEAMEKSIHEAEARPRGPARRRRGGGDRSCAPEVGVRGAAVGSGRRRPALSPLAGARGASRFRMTWRQVSNLPPRLTSPARLPSASRAAGP